MLWNWAGTPQRTIDKAPRQRGAHGLAGEATRVLTLLWLLRVQVAKTAQQPRRRSPLRRLRQTRWAAPPPRGPRSPHPR